MGAGKGKNHRAKMISTSVKKPPKPKFRINDEIKSCMPPTNTVHPDAPSAGYIDEIVYNNKQNIYCYRIVGGAKYCEDDIALIKNAYPNEKNNFHDYLHKTVTFQYRSKKWKKTFPELKKLDGQKAQITGVLRDSWCRGAIFRLHFNGTTEGANSEILNAQFSQEDLKFVLPVSLTLESQELGSIPSF